MNFKKRFIENALAVKEQITYEITVEDKECYVTEIRQVSGLFWVKMILNNVSTLYYKESFRFSKTNQISYLFKVSS